MAQKLPAEFGAKRLECVTQTRLPENSPRLLDDATVKKIYDAIMNYANPEIVVSHLGRRKAGYRALVNFAHTFGLPVSDFRSFLNFPITDSLHVGFPFLTQPPCLMPDVDLAVALELGLLPHQRFGDADAIDLTSDLLHRQDVPAEANMAQRFSPR